MKKKKFTIFSSQMSSDTEILAAVEHRLDQLIYNEQGQQGLLELDMLIQTLKTKRNSILVSYVKGANEFFINDIPFVVPFGVSMEDIVGNYLKDKGLRPMIYIQTNEKDDPFGKFDKLLGNLGVPIANCPLAPHWKTTLDIQRQFQETGFEEHFDEVVANMLM